MKVVVAAVAVVHHQVLVVQVVLVQVVQAVYNHYPIIQNQKSNKKNINKKFLTFQLIQNHLKEIIILSMILMDQKN